MYLNYTFKIKILSRKISVSVLHFIIFCFMFECLQVNEAEEERLRSEREHQRVTQLCQEAEARVQTLQKALKRVIIKSKPYFELKAQFNHILEVCIRV